MTQLPVSRFDSMIANILQTAQLASIYDSENTENEHTITEVAKNAYKIKAEIVKSGKSFQETKHLPTIQEFDDAYKTLMIKKTKPNNNEMNQTISEIKKLFAGKDGPESTPAQMESDETLDLIMEENPDNLIDPITKTQIQIPVRNKVCGHLYDKSSILDSIRIYPRMKCPVVGCKSKQVVTANQLILDEKVARLL